MTDKNTLQQAVSLGIPESLVGGTPPSAASHYWAEWKAARILAIHLGTSPGDLGQLHD